MKKKTAIDVMGEEARAIAKNHNIKNIDRLMDILRRCVTDFAQEELDEAGPINQFIRLYIAMARATLENALQFLPIGQVEKLFYSDDFYRLEHRKAIFRELFHGCSYTHQELIQLIEKFIFGY